MTKSSSCLYEGYYFFVFLKGWADHTSQCWKKVKTAGIGKKKNKKQTPLQKSNIHWIRLFNLNRNTRNNGPRFRPFR